MIRPPPRSTRVRSSAASDVYKRQSQIRRIPCIPSVGLPPAGRSATGDERRSTVIGTGTGSSPRGPTQPGVWICLCPDVLHWGSLRVPPERREAKGGDSPLRGLLGGGGVRGGSTHVDHFLGSHGSLFRLSNLGSGHT